MAPLILVFFQARVSVSSLAELDVAKDSAASMLRDRVVMAVEKQSVRKLFWKKLFWNSELEFGFIKFL